MEINAGGNQATRLTYDPLNRRTQATYADGAVATFTYDAAGRLTLADDTADPHQPIALAYDPLDRLISETTAMGTVSYAYDSIGRRSQMTVAGQAPVAYAYDANSRLTQLVQEPLAPVTLQYDAAGRRTLLTLPNQVSTEYQYDPASRLTALLYRNALGSLGDLTYAYDPAGNRTSVGGSFARTMLPDPVPTATYDAANQQLAFGGKTMTFDANGNLATLTDSTGSTTFTWDARDRLVSVTDPGLAATFTYGAGSRRSATINAQQTVYLHDWLDITQEVVDGTPVTYLSGLRIDEPLARAGAEFYLTNDLGSVVALTDTTGALRTRYVYEPFGRTEAEGLPSANRFQFTARESDETGFYYFRARYYSASLHRFLSEDPFGLAGGMNLYAFVWNSPTNLIDPEGLCPSSGANVAANFAGGTLAGGGGGLVYAATYENRPTSTGQARLGRPDAASRYGWERSFHIDRARNGRVHLNADFGPLKPIAGPPPHLGLPRPLYHLGSTSALKALGRSTLVAGVALDAYDIATAGPCDRGRAIGGAIGGWGGAFAGAAVGSAITPGVGTVIGGLVGGFAGSGSGQFVSANPISIGDTILAP